MESMLVKYGKDNYKVVESFSYAHYVTDKNGATKHYPRSYQKPKSAKIIGTYHSTILPIPFEMGKVKRFETWIIKR